MQVIFEQPLVKRFGRDRWAGCWAMALTKPVRWSAKSQCGFARSSVGFCLARAADEWRRLLASSGGLKPRNADRPEPSSAVQHLMAIYQRLASQLDLDY